MPPTATPASAIDSSQAWWRLLASMLAMTIGGVGMYAPAVVLPQIEADFGVSRADASFPYAAALVGFGIGNLLMGRLADRIGAMRVVQIGAMALGLGYLWAGHATSLWQFSLAHALLIGLLGTSTTFAPLVADTSLWFQRRRGLAVAICLSGNYLAGTLWAPTLQSMVAAHGWRATFVGLGVFCAISMALLSLMLRRPPPQAVAPAQTGASGVAAAPVATPAALGLSPGGLEALLCVAGVACCVAMAMPQVHIVAYCTDLGIGPARGSQMLAVMMATGVASRLISGWIADRIGGLRTLLLGSVLQGLALLLFLPFDGLVSLFVVSALFGLFQGGIVPSYPLIVREFFGAERAGQRVGTVLMATLLGMALGGWLSGAIFDWTGSYHEAFINGIAWNAVNLGIVLFLMGRLRRHQRGWTGAR